MYIYGSHDLFQDSYSGPNQVVWSAPVDDPANWRYDGVIFSLTEDTNGEHLYHGCTSETLSAPDIALRMVNGK